MDVIFETPKGKKVYIEVGFFDTVLEMKEKVQKYEGTPIARQTLIFNGKIMADERDTEFYEVLQGSHIQLLVEPEEKKLIKTEDTILIKIQTSNKQFMLTMHIMDTVSRLKDRIHDNEDIPINRFVLYYSGAELQDHRSLGEYGICDHSEIVVILKPLPPKTTTTTSKKLKFIVQSQCGKKKIPLEVNPLDNVGELRKELQRLHRHYDFHLPPEGYFFIHKQSVMDDDHSFRWHNVRQGDTIDLLHGTVTNGS
ncbi:ubiquitin-like domain-containing protein [Tasmannia lanceolata]|uniref:ubiquitin-like domain-containing protein n=1 Tax=Tasmannia lanceolata TaxID=3420 RepID=UPI004064181C